MSLMSEVLILTRFKLDSQGRLITGGSDLTVKSPLETLGICISILIVRTGVVHGFQYFS